MPSVSSQSARTQGTAATDGRPYLKIRYDTHEFPFVEKVKSIMGLSESSLALLGDGSEHRERWQRRNDQASQWHRDFYDRFAELRPDYLRLIAGPVRDFMGEDFYYQAVPTFRVHLPRNVAVGEFHTDGQYGHPVGELSFWTPLTRAWDTNSVWVERNRGEGDYEAVEAAPGDIAVFNAVELRHGNRENTTGSTRVSFDFRCVPTRLYSPGDSVSINTGMKFEPGDYYNANMMAGSTND